MALITDFPADLGTLAADTVITCESGAVGITTDGGTGDDCYKLSEGQRLVLASGLDVTISERTGPARVHHMPV